MRFAFYSLIVRYGRRTILNNSTTRMRLAGKICYFCGRYLNATLWQPPGERACDSCAAQRAPAPKLRRIHMSFVLHSTACLRTEGRRLRTASSVITDAPVAELYVRWLVSTAPLSVQMGVTGTTNQAYMFKRREPLMTRLTRKSCFSLGFATGPLAPR